MRNNKEEIKSNKRLTNKPNDTTQLLDNELVQLAVESGNNQYYGELYRGIMIRYMANAYLCSKMPP